MGLRFRKSIKIAPGVKINLNKNSIGMTLGGRGAQYTVNTKGRSTSTVGLPGTGLSYSSFSDSGKAKRGKRRTQQNANTSFDTPETPKSTKQKTGKTAFIVWSVLAVIMLLGASPVGFVFLIIAIVFGFRYFKKKKALSQETDTKQVRADAPPPEVQGIAISSELTNINSTPEVPATIQSLSTELRDWKVSVSFGKSSSQNYQKALYLAKTAPTYHEQVDDGHILHQAIYSAKPQEYLAFISLYELVSAWKSSFVMINGSIIDRKIIGQLNYCYGDKCRSGNPQFCFGASELTANPFGCHRIQVSAANNPWWSFGELLYDGKQYHVDKHAIKGRIDSYARVYNICPCFDYENIIQVLNALPTSLSMQEYRKLASSLSVVASIDIKVGY